jgi:KaiC/GvpD/RAD55 family RecA-like ATPase
MIELLRKPLLESLETAASAGSILVIGEPGAGKSWLLAAFVASRKKAGDGVVFLRAEDHVADSLTSLLHSIGTRDFLAALRAYPGTRKYLVIDSLDSLRAEAAQRAFRDLIRTVQREVPDFTVLASMRTFDARQSVEFQQLFPPKGEAPPNSLSILARNIVVPVFSYAELREAVEMDSRLGPILVSASPAGRALLRNPFNLWLIIHLLDAGARVDWLSSVQSEVQLLDQYWRFRIESRRNASQRKRLLSLLTDKMVSTNTLSVALRETATDREQDELLQELLSDEILSKSESDRLGYSHNILFDFAVSMLLIDEENIVQFVLAGPARSIFYRPSISFLMARLWFRDRKLFWRSVEPFFEEKAAVSAIAAITPASVLYDVAQTHDDLLPILQLPDSKKSRAIVFLLRAIQAFDGLRSKKRRLWTEFLISLSHQPSKAFLNEYIALLEAAAISDEASSTEKSQTGEASVMLLRWLWETAAAESDSSLAQNLTDVAASRLIPLVAKQYSVIPSRARDVLKDVIARLGNPRASANEAFRLANNLDGVIETDPQFASDIYIGVLGFEETSTEPTQMGGAVLPLRSTRAQDFSMASYVLGIKYPQLLTRDLHIAARTAVLSITAEVKQKEGDTVSKIGAYNTRFNYRGKTSVFVSDRSEIWDQSHKNYTSLQLYAHLLRTLTEQMADGGVSLEEVREVIIAIAEENTFAVTWKRTLEFAATNAGLLAAIPELLQAPEILGAPETTVAAGRAIARAFESKVLPPVDLAAIESAILQIPDSSIAGVYKDSTVIRNRLLGCIPEAHLSEASKDIVRELKKTTGVPTNTPFFQLGPARFGPDSEDAWLKRQGVETEREDNQELLAASRSLKTFETRFMNETPSESDSTTILDNLWAAYTLLLSRKSADDKVVTDVFTTIAAVAHRVLVNDKLPKDSTAISRCRTIVLDAAAYPLPTVSSDADAHFDRPMWAPTPRIEAAQGVMHYIRNWGLDPILEATAERLSEDPSPAVRFQIASSLTGVYDRNRNFFWRIANARLSIENATGVLVALARSVVHAYIAKMERKAVLEWESALLARELPKQHTEDVFEVIVDSLTQLFVYYADDRASELLTTFEKQPAAHASQLSQMAMSASYYLAYSLNSDTSDAKNVRLRSRSTLTRVLEAADLAVMTADDIGEALRVVDNVVFRLYLSVGVNEGLSRPDVKPIRDSERRILFFELGPLWKRLTTPIAPNQRRLLAAQTTHHLMEVFSSTLHYDPPVVLQFASDLLRGYTMGYQFDSMARDEIVRFADVVLADHKDILQDPTNASNLGSILDVFVEAGWSEATQLVMKLDSAVR